MSKVKKLTSYFKVVTKDEREVEELLATQLLVVKDFWSFFCDTLYDYE